MAFPSSTELVILLKKALMLVRYDQPVVVFMLLLSLLEDGVMFAFFQSSETSSVCHSLSNIIESGLMVTLASSISSPGWIPSGYRALGISRLFISSLT